MSFIKHCIFDLDGVIVDTAKFHYLAWKRLAKELGFELKPIQNERLKGVSRVQSLEILLSIGNIKASDEEKSRMADQKNEWYVQYISSMTPKDILPGAKEFILKVRENGIKTSLGSVSKNAALILEKIAITHLFDCIVDGTRITKAKPDPQVFLISCEELAVTPSESVVFEDSIAGIQAALAGGMHSIGIGNAKILSMAERIIPDFTHADMSILVY